MNVGNLTNQELISRKIELENIFKEKKLLSKKEERVLEFASVMTPPTEFLHRSKDAKNSAVKVTDEINEGSKLHLDQLQAINNVLGSVECPSCKEKSLGSIEMIDLEKQIVRVKCGACEAVVKADLAPMVEIIKKGKKQEKSDILVTIEKSEGNKKMKEKGKHPKFTVKCDSCGNIFESDVRGESTPCVKCGGTTKTIGDQASIQEEEKIMKEKIEGLEKELASLKEEGTKVKAELTEKSDALDKANATIEELKKESEEAKVKIEEVEKAKAEEIKTAKADAIKITERKTELGEEFSKDLDLLDDKVYELAKARKELSEKDAEIATLKEGKTIVTDLNKGSTDKTVDDEITKKHSKVQKIAYGE